MNNPYRISGITFLLISLLCFSGVCSAKKDMGDIQLNELREVNNGFLEKTGGDPFVIFPEINESTCSPKGVELSIAFEPILKTPMLIEMFWETEFLGFGEENKVFFVLSPQKKDQPNHFIVPLDHTAGFTKIRLDFPADLSTTFKIIKYNIVSLNNPPVDIPIVDTYYSLSVEDSLKPQILIPFLIKSLKHGVLRIAHDPYFLLFWMLLLASLLFLIRYTSKQTTT